MNFQQFKQNNCIVIKISGRMDASNSSEFENFMDTVLSEHSEDIVIDLEGLDYISSAGLRSILITGKNMKTKRQELKLCNLQDDVMEVFEISGFSSIFNIFDSIEAAVE